VGKLIKPSHIRVYQKTLGKVIQDLGREIYIYVGSGIPSALWDPVNNEPVDPNTGLTYSDVIHTVTATIRWIKKDEIQFSEGGTIVPGDVRVRCKLQDVLVSGSNVNGPTYFDIARKIVVDGEECELIERPIRSGLKDLFTITAYLKRVPDAD
jgi:hypothetical protein